jgi:hypothetical protein
VQIRHTPNVVKQQPSKGIVQQAVGCEVTPKGVLTARSSPCRWPLALLLLLQ